MARSEVILENRGGVSDREGKCLDLTIDGCVPITTTVFFG